MKNDPNRDTCRFNAAKEIICKHRDRSIQITPSETQRVIGEKTEYGKELSAVWDNIRWVNMSISQEKRKWKKKVERIIPEHFLKIVKEIKLKAQEIQRI